MHTDVTVAQRSKAPNPTVWLEVTYLGTEPPLDLFADLEMIGWRPPVPASPPAWAIDWSTPNEQTGERFTIRAWTVEGAVVEPPTGHGPRGHWTEHDRTAFLLGLEGVLRRHGLVEPPPPPPDAPLVGLDDGRDVATPAVAPTPPAVPTAEVVPPEAPVAPSTASPSVVRAAITPASLRDAVSDAVAPLGVTSHIDVAERTVRNTYRGTSFETVKQVLEIEVLCDPSLVDVVQAVLRDLGLDPSVTATPSPVPADGGDPIDLRSEEAGSDGEVELEAAAPAPPPPPPAALVPPAGASLVCVVVSPAAEDRAVSLLARHAVGRVQALPATVTERNTYRGTTFETEKPAVRVVCPVEPAQAHEVAATTAAALALDVEDRTRVLVIDAGPVDVEATPTDSPADV